jgi:hypothetical protein
MFDIFQENFPDSCPIQEQLRKWLRMVQLGQHGKDLAISECGAVDGMLREGDWLERAAWRQDD